MTIVRTKTPAGEAIVILSEAEFERLRDLAEDALDARAIDVSGMRLQAGREELPSDSDLDLLRTAPSALAFWRARRGIPIKALAHDGAVSLEILAAMEAGARMAEPAVYDRLARVLGIEAEDIAPGR